MAYRIDQISFKLGAIAAFSELVGIDAKKMAFSSPFLPAEYDDLDDDAKQIVHKCGAKIELEKNLIVTDLFRKEITKGRWVYIIYKDPAVMECYTDLKCKKAQLIKRGSYYGEQRQTIAVDLGKLLGYKTEAIENYINTNPNKE